MLRMIENKSITMYTTNIINSVALDNVYLSLKIARQILNSLQKRWEPKLTTILEANTLKIRIRKRKDKEELDT